MCHFVRSAICCLLFREMPLLMRFLQSLDVSFNSLTTFPAKFDALENLQELVASNNLLTELPYGLVKLKALEISFNKLTQLSVPSKHTWPKLRVLSLGNNQISQLLPTVEHLTSLKQLWLANNLIEYIPPEIRRQASFH
jgi:Leucine-rich repeat (LRR) protein